MSTSIDTLILAPDVLANRPAAGSAGRIFPATDTGLWYRDNGISWDVIPPVQSANKVFAGPSSGGSAAPAFRALVAADVPAHASSHDPSGTDPIHDLSRLAGGPASLGLLAWNFDLGASSGGFAPTAGTIYLAKILTAHAMTINEIDLYITVAGSGATSLANCFVGIYDSSGTRQFASADQSSSWNSVGLKRITVTGGYTVTANDYIYIAFLIGTQSSTACQLTKASYAGASGATNNQGANVAGAYRMASNGTGKTSLTSPSLTLSSNAGVAQLIWTGVA